MVICSACGQAQQHCTRCLLCGGELQPSTDAPPSIAAFTPFLLTRAQALDALRADSWSVPGADELAENLRRGWLATWRCDVRLDAAWEAELKLPGGWEPRAGWVDHWFDELVCAAPGFDGFPSEEPRALGTPEDLPLLYSSLQPPDACWRPALGALLCQATGAQAMRAMWTDNDPEEQRWSCVLTPIWLTGSGQQTLLIQAQTGLVRGALEPDIPRGRRWAAILALTGLVCLMLSAIVALPGILIWPLLVITALGALLGFGLLVAAGLPLSWTRR